MPTWSYRSLTVRISIGLALMLFLLIATAIYSVWSFSVNETAYRQLTDVNLLETSLRGLRRHAENYVAAAPRTYPDYYRDLEVYHQQLQDDLSVIDAIIADLADFGPASAPFISSRQAGDIGRDVAGLAARWGTFRSGLMEALGDDPEEPRLEWGAEHIVGESDALIEAAASLADATREAVATRRERMMQLGIWGGAAALGSAMALMLWFYRAVIRRMHSMSRAFRQASRGNLRHQIRVSGQDELSELARDYNRMAARLDALLRMLDRVQLGTDPETTLDNLWLELHEQTDIDCLALMELDPSGTQIRIRHQQTGNGIGFPEEPALPADESWLAMLETGSEIVIAREAGSAAAKLKSQGLDSVVLMHLPSDRHERLVLAAGATDAEAFDHDLLALFRNAAELIGHAFDKSAYAERLLLASVTGLAKLAERRDPETGDHLLRMARYSGILAEELARSPGWRNRLPPRFARDVERFAPLHDIGKVGIDDSILLKPGKLTAGEREKMQRHTLIGGEVLRHSAREIGADGTRLFRVAFEIAEGHHEKYDGSGYPRGLAGEEIPLAARIVAVADVFDALTSKRPYKEAWPIQEALEFMERESGRHFDPAVLGALESGTDRILAVYRVHRHI